MASRPAQHAGTRATGKLNHLVPTARLDIEYDGTGFGGWARQPGLRTVQGELERALATRLRRPVALTVAGRTDRGVHAWRQVASYEASRPDRTVGSTRCCARRRRAAAQRCARRLRRPPRRPLAHLLLPRADRRARRPVRAAAGRCGGPTRRTSARSRPAPPRCSGTHDFTAFTPDRDRPRALRAHRVRRALGARRRPARLLDHRRRLHAQHEPRARGDDARGRRRPAHARRRSAPSSPAARGRDAGETAPPHGLYLASVAY